MSTDNHPLHLNFLLIKYSPDSLRVIDFICIIMSVLFLHVIRNYYITLSIFSIFFFSLDSRSMNSTGLVSVMHVGTIIFPVELVKHASKHGQIISSSSSSTSSSNIKAATGSDTAHDLDSNLNSDTHPPLDCDTHRDSHTITDTNINSTTNTMSNTAVVTELMETLVYPSLHLDSKLHLRGVLLLGPPGVGKTFAVKALRTYCKEFCTVRRDTYK